MTACGLHDRLLKVELVFLHRISPLGIEKAVLSGEGALRGLSITNRGFLDGQKTNDLNLLWQPSRDLERHQHKRQEVKFLPVESFIGLFSSRRIMFLS